MSASLAASLHAAEGVFTVIFTLEMCIKVHSRDCARTHASLVTRWCRWLDCGGGAGTWLFLGRGGTGSTAS